MAPHCLTFIFTSNLMLHRTQSIIIFLYVYLFTCKIYKQNLYKNSPQYIENFDSVMSEGDKNFSSHSRAYKRPIYSIIDLTKPHLVNINR